MRKLLVFLPIAVALLVLCSLVINRSGSQNPWAPLPAFAVTPTAQVTASPVVSPVYRIGVNTGNNDDFFGPGAFDANYFANPGFEPISIGKLGIVGSGSTSSTYVDTNDNGNTYNWNPSSTQTCTGSVRTGASAGDTFTITAYAPGTQTFTYGTCLNATGGSISCPVLEQNAAVAEVCTGPGVLGGMLNPSAGGNPGATGWQQSDTNCNFTTADSKDGLGAASCNVADGNSHNFQHYFDYANPDSTGGVCSNDNNTPCTIANQAADCGAGTCLVAPQAGPFHPIVGAFEIAFWAKGVNTSTGTPQVTVGLVRGGGGTNVSHTFTLTNDGNWHQYVFNFTGTDVGWTGGQNGSNLVFTLTATNNTPATGAAIEIDDAYLGKQASASTGFRSEFTQAINAMNPGSLRFMSGGTMSAPRTALEGLSGCTPGQGSGPDAVGTCDFQHGPANGTLGNQLIFGSQWMYSSADMYPLANTVKAAPWFSISNMFSDADLKTFIDNACTNLATYTNIPAIYIEQSNEEWNSSFPTLSVRYGSQLLQANLGFGAEMGRNYSIMRAEIAAQCPALTSKFNFQVDGISCNGSTFGGTLTGASNAGFAVPNTSTNNVNGATYLGGTLQNYAGSLTSQAQQYYSFMIGQASNYWAAEGTGAGGCINGVNGTGAADWSFMGSNMGESIYETGPNNFTGPGSVEQAYLSEGGYGSAGFMAYDWLIGQQGQNQPQQSVPFPGGRVPVQNEYQVAQIEAGGAPMWGVVHDLDCDFGPTCPHLRPIAIAEEIVNAGIQQGGFLYGVNQVPTGITVNAYNSNNSGTGLWSASMVNTTNAAITYTLNFLATGTVPNACEADTASLGIVANNENSNGVVVGGCTGFSCTGQACTVTVGAQQVVAFMPNTGGATPTPTPSATPTGATPTATLSPTTTATISATPSATPTSCGSAPSVVNSGAPNFAFSNQISMAAPANLATGNMLCVSLVTNNTGTGWVPPRGFVLESKGNSGALGVNQQTFCALFNNTGAQPYTFVATNPTTNFVISGGVIQITGETQTTTLDAVGVPACLNNSAQRPTANSVTTSNNDLVLWFYDNISNAAASQPIGFSGTNLYTNVETNSDTAGSAVFNATSTGAQAATGWTGPAAWCAEMIGVAPICQATATPTLTATPSTTPTTSATPTTTATLTVTATPTGGGTFTPSITPTPTPTTTATISATPTLTTTATPSATPSPVCSIPTNAGPLACPAAGPGISITGPMISAVPNGYRLANLPTCNASTFGTSAASPVIAIDSDSACVYGNTPTHSTCTVGTNCFTCSLKCSETGGSTYSWVAQ